MEQIKQELRQARDLIESALAQMEPGNIVPAEPSERKIIYGQRVSAEFKASVLWIEEKLNLNADFLMACMSFETGGSFDPAQRNMAGSSGTGLIQFMSFTAKNLGTTTAKLARMSAVQQLGYVYKYFKMFRTDYSGFTLEDVYMTILFPKAIGKPLDWPMPWEYGKIAYRQNRGLDRNKDRVITKAEASSHVREHYRMGQNLKA